jgi:hypothetical protein|tara:strand:- start:967 stop:1548 length:582 start_codon:yes stop_codon:yes gene_type:complete
MRSLILLEKTQASRADPIVYTNAEALDPKHTGGGTTENFIYNSPGSMAKKALYALDATGVAVKTFRQPLQVAIPKSSPILFDVGSYRPLISVSGVLPREAAPAAHTVPFDGQEYFTPTYFQLQHAVTQWNYVQGEEILLTLLHTNVDSVTYDQYNVAIQSANFGLNSASPNFWTYELAFVATRSVAGNPSQNV